MRHPQINLRDVMARTALDHLDLATPKGIVEAAVAAMGAAAIFVALLPKAEADRVIESLSDALPASVAQRRREIDSGELDRQMGGLS